MSKPKIESYFGTGRLLEIIHALKQYYGVSDVVGLDPRLKLNCLCKALQLTHEQFDRLISENSPVLRTVKGHAFEVFFDTILTKNGYKVTEVGGDEAVDRIVNEKTLQLKTPTLSGTSRNSVQYKTHKTHGAKSEKESFCYYHSKREFADYLVGLISYQPLRILFLHRDELPTHPKAPERICSPFNVVWQNHPGLNAFDRIGIKKIKLPTTDSKIDYDQELLPRTSAMLQLNSDVVLNAILRESNFRIWDMAIRGFAREIAFGDYLKVKGILLFDPSKSSRTRSDKSDVAVVHFASNKYCLLQIKGLSTNNCRFTGKDSTVAIETQLTRGRVSDHPTQSRLYLVSDFDFLIIGIDPCLTFKYLSEIDASPELLWKFYAVPTKELERHHKIHRRLKSLQVFKYIDLGKFAIGKDWLNLWKKGRQSGS